MSVVVVSFNAGEHLRACVDSLRGQTLHGFEAIVVDNGSTDGAFERVRRATGDPRFRFLALGVNRGFAGANNLGAARAAAPWLALLNPDAVAAPDWLERLLDAARRHPGVDMFGSTQIDARDPKRLDGAGDAYHALGVPWRGGFGHPVADLPPEGETFSPCAAAALIRTASFRAAGGFDEDYFCFCEDVDLAFRLRLLGARCIQVPGAVVRHVGGASAGAGSDFARYHGTRNLVWTFLKNTPAPWLALLLPAHALACGYLLARAALRGSPGPVWRGLRDAWRGLAAVRAKRRRIQAAAPHGARAWRRAVTWSPLPYLRRAPVIRATRT